MGNGISLALVSSSSACPSKVTIAEGSMLPPPRGIGGEGVGEADRLASLSPLRGSPCWASSGETTSSVDRSIFLAAD